MREIGRFQQAIVGPRHQVARFQQHNVPGHELTRGDFLHMTVATDFDRGDGEPFLRAAMACPA